MRRFALSRSGAGLMLLLAACGRAPTPDPSRVAVEVNREPVTVHQLDDLLEHLAPAASSAEHRQQATAEALAALIDERLLVQRALDRNLDRDPRVVRAIEAARRQVLAQAYADSAIGAAVKPSGDEIRRYYDDNPALFAQRRVYGLQQLEITAIDPQRLAQLDARAARSRSIAEIAGWLNARAIAFSADTGVRGAEQLPLSLLPKVAAMKDGNIRVFQDDGRTLVIELMHAEPRPIDFEQASSSIAQFLANRKRETLVRDEVTKLRQSSRIEFVGAYAKFAPGGELVIATGGHPGGAASGPAPRSVIDGGK